MIKKGFTIVCRLLISGEVLMCLVGGKKERGEGRRECELIPGAHSEEAIVLTTPKRYISHGVI